MSLTLEQAGALIIKSTRKGYRYPSIKGPLSVEQLWKVPLIEGGNVKDKPVEERFDLNCSALLIDKQIKNLSQSSYVNRTPSRELRLLQEMFDIVLFVIDTKEKEERRKAKRNKQAEARANLIAILEVKKEEKLMSSSEEEIQAMIDSLGDEEDDDYDD
jgi:hypothetical protein